jgi:hypothetical protein
MVGPLLDVFDTFKSIEVIQPGMRFISENKLKASLPMLGTHSYFSKIFMQIDGDNYQVSRDTIIFTSEILTTLAKDTSLSPWKKINLLERFIISSETHLMHHLSIFYEAF